MKGAIAKAREIVASTPGAWLPMQFDNPANVEVHRRTTAEEIRRELPRRPRLHLRRRGHGRPCLGPSARCSDRAGPSLQVFAVEPELLAGSERRKPRPAIPSRARGRLHSGNYHPARSTASCRFSARPMRSASRSGRSGRGAAGRGFVGAVLAAVARSCRSQGRRPRILAFTYDTGERYLTVPGLFEVEPEAVAVP